MQKKFSVGDKVKWTSESGGYATEKTGTVVAVVTPNRFVRDAVGDPAGYALRTDFSGRRNEESYLVAVPGKTERSRPLLYWPRTNHLERV